MGEVRVEVPHSGSYDERMQWEDIRQRLSRVGDVMMDPPVGDTGMAAFYLYADDVDQLLESVRGALEGVNLPAGSYAVKEGERVDLA